MPSNFLKLHFFVEKKIFFHFFFSGRATTTTGRCPSQPKSDCFEPKLNPIWTVFDVNWPIG